MGAEESINQLQWAVTAPLLAASLAGRAGALGLTIGLCALMTVYYFSLHPSWRSYRVQVRLGFMSVVALACVPGLELLLVVPLFGTSAQVLFGYCPMARFLDLMPWNRTEPFSTELVIECFTRPSGPEGLLPLARRALALRRSSRRVIC